MADTTVETAPAGGHKITSMRTVIAASSAGTAFEWYDFFVFASLAEQISKAFFSGLNETAGYIAALALFGTGFLFRPVGALIFGRIGDKLGRKGAFLATVLMMGGATFAIALLPSYAQAESWFHAGFIAPLLLVFMRILQGIALGGEYGGAAIYVAEHSAPNKRGWSTSWVQTSAAFGLFGALGVIYVTTQIVGKDAFGAWGWRIPFGFSIFLLGISVFMRLKLSESPAFAKMQAEGESSKAPYREAFGHWPNLKLVLLAFFSMMSAQGALWYTAFFYIQTFMLKFLKLEPSTINALMMTATAISAVGYVLFGWLSDKVGRKWVMLFGMTLGLVFYFPGFHLLERFANPALAEASERTPVTVVADPADCALQFDPVGKAAFLSSCDIAKSTLANAGVSYENEAGPKGAPAVVRVGTSQVTVASAAHLPKAEAKTVKTAGETAVKAALKAAGYPAKADPARINFLGLLGVLFVFVIAATALFGPIAACLVELFPTRVRYTALSLPYHIGTGWVGGFVPFTAFAIVAATGNIYAGLWYPFAFTLLSVLAAFFFLPETNGRPLDQ